MKKITEEWLSAAADDLMVVRRIIEDKTLTHMAAFHTQQAIEKAFKAIIEENSIEVPRIHNLVNLYERIRHLVPSELDITILKVLDELYVDSRYPGTLGLLPDGKPSIEEAKSYNNYSINICDSIRKYLANK